MPFRFVHACQRDGHPFRVQLAGAGGVARGRASRLRGEGQTALVTPSTATLVLVWLLVIDGLLCWFGGVGWYIRQREPDWREAIGEGLRSRAVGQGQMAAWLFAPIPTGVLVSALAALPLLALGLAVSL